MSHPHFADCSLSALLPLFPPVHTLSLHAFSRFLIQSSAGDAQAGLTGRLFVYACVCSCICTLVCAGMWRSEVNVVSSLVNPHLIIFLKIYFYLYICVYLSICMLHMCRYPWCQKRALNSPEQELPDRGVGNPAQPSGKAASALNC